jgi:hypothetical protein
MDRLPGFTAGLSLYTTERRYSSVPVRDSAPEGIQMAKLGETSYTNCGWTCIYDYVDCISFCPRPSDEFADCFTRCNRGHDLCTYSCRAGRSAGLLQ